MGLPIKQRFVNTKYKIMNRLLFNCLVIGSFIYVACTPERFANTKNELGKLVTINVECINNEMTQKTVIQVLKRVRVSDWKIANHGDCVIIETRYKELAPMVYLDIKQQIKEFPGVMNVEIKEGGRPGIFCE
jgi:hypothetical protein